MAPLEVMRSAPFASYVSSLKKGRNNGILFHFSIQRTCISHSCLVHPILHSAFIRWCVFSSLLPSSSNLFLLLIALSEYRAQNLFLRSEEHLGEEHLIPWEIFINAINGDMLQKRFKILLSAKFTYCHPSLKNFQYCPRWEFQKSLSNCIFHLHSGSRGLSFRDIQEML